MEKIELVKTDQIDLESSTDSEFDIEKSPDCHVSYKFFYRPHKIAICCFIFCLLSFFTLIRDEDASFEKNIKISIFVVHIIFITVISQISPTGSFFRPHPLIWKVSLAYGILYILFLSFCLFQSYDTIRKILFYVDPQLVLAVPDTKIYAVNCDKWEKVIESFDIFMVAHFFGHATKAIILRSSPLAWLVSVNWEVTEIAFIHILPNFAECWWDSLILDILLCNGLGITFGMLVCRFFQIRKYNWESVRKIKGAGGKLRRVILQFTPEHWNRNYWFLFNSPIKRFFSLCGLVLMFQVIELNCFFLKHIYILPTHHYLVIARLVLMGFLAVPGTRSFYVYISDPRAKTFSMHFFTLIVITLLELLLCIKDGRKVFPAVNLINIFTWLVFQFAVVFVLLGAMMKASKHFKNL